VKADVILIAEPWSFRGHSAAALRSTGYASWNDGYRDFLRAYVHGRGTTEKMEYFLKGSPWHFAYWPAQTVNYTESHDDRTWVDMITERGDHNGFDPTPADRQRTHLMAAILLASIGIPLLAAGQDFLRSKYGVTNTYQRGDLNALDYQRLTPFAETHKYFADWIAFRRSPRGHLLRQWSRPSEGFFQCIAQLDGPALVVIYNADGSQGPERILLALNPHMAPATIALGKFADWKWRPIADQESFYGAGQGHSMSISVDLCIPKLGCSLWVTER
jgi:pullulanase/glycogen debranching enzyme